jgi:hypothetical protein
VPKGRLFHQDQLAIRRSPSKPLVNMLPFFTGTGVTTRRFFLPTKSEKHRVSARPMRLHPTQHRVTSFQEPRDEDEAKTQERTITEAFLF